MSNNSYVERLVCVAAGWQKMKKAVLLCGSGSAVEFQFSMSSSACLRNNHKPNLHNNGLNQKCKKQQQTLPLMMINLRSHGRKYYLFNNIVFHSTAARILLVGRQIDFKL